MLDVTRRQFLQFLGAAGATATLGPLAGLREAQATGLPLSFTPIRVPHPLPVYTTSASWLATGFGAGVKLPASEDAQLAEYTVIDDVVVPPEFERYIIAAWGDRWFFPNPDDYFGYNCDHTGYVPIRGRNEGWLVVNHEYVSYPIHELAPETPAGAFTTRTFEAVIKTVTLPPAPGSGKTLADLTPAERRNLFGELLYNCGLSVVRIRRDPKTDRFGPEKDKRNRRIHGLSGLAANASRSDVYQGVTAWGVTPHQTGDDNYLVGTGPAAKEVFEFVNADGLGNKIIGTFANCSGGVSPWGTVFSAEENFQGSAPFYVGVTEGVKPNGSQTGYTAGTVAEVFGMVGEKYGWMVEVDPDDPGKRVKKHTALGRFRHENIAFRAEQGEPLICYMGDDRRSGHWWKFVSKGVIRHRKSGKNSDLLEDGTLYVARFNTDGTGRWIPLSLATPLEPNKPSVLGSKQKEQQGTIDRDGRTVVPARVGMPGVTTDGGFFNMTTLNEGAVLAFLATKQSLADFYPTQGALLCDAFAAANLIGGTPAARPEDCEVHPWTKDVYLACTDAAAGSDGYADSRIFNVAKYTSAIDAAQQSGDILRIVEDSKDGSGLTFRWDRFSKAGEDGTEPGVEADAKSGNGYANVDNLVFDKRGNVWGVTDVSTDLHNGFNTAPAYAAVPINHSSVGSATGTSGTGGNLVGVFGNNWMFYIPTVGPRAGFIVPFAIGPNRCEMTGPTFIGDTLVLSVQHPGENVTFGSDATTLLTRTTQILALDGSGTFDQTRNVGKGSQWPGNVGAKPAYIPKPTVIGIRRRGGRPDWDDGRGDWDDKDHKEDREDDKGGKTER